MFKLTNVWRLVLTTAFLTTAVWAQQTDGEAAKFYDLTRNTSAAYVNGDAERAKAFATDLLTEAENWKTNWNHGNALHVGNLVLGLVALDFDDRVEAKKRLLAAGSTPGSPQLDTFGPNMLLAERLLAKGEVVTVLEYFELCGKFWKRGSNETLAAWATSVRAGTTPSFGANLKYGL